MFIHVLWLTAVPACCTAATSAIGRWKKLRKAVGEPIYGEKTVLAGMVQLAATGVRGLPREPLPLNLMPPPPSVDPVRQRLRVEALREGRKLISWQSGIISRQSGIRSW